MMDMRSSQIPDRESTRDAPPPAPRLPRLAVPESWRGSMTGHQDVHVDSTVCRAHQHATGAFLLTGSATGRGTARVAAAR